MSSTGRSDPDEIVLLAEVRGRPAGALLARLRPGRTAFVWPPVATKSDIADGIVDSLISECICRLDAAGVAVGQALLENDDLAGRDAFARNGFPRLTRLQLLVRRIDESLPPLFSIAWKRLSYVPTDHKKFVRLIEATFAGSLDCAELHNSLSGEDALAVHRASGEFVPRFWLRFEIAGNDVGLILVNPHPDLDSCEVNYVGVIPEYRGQGLGRAMLVEALHLVRDESFPEAFLAVDEKNHFARRIYRKLGFILRESRDVHFRLPAQHSAR